MNVRLAATLLGVWCGFGVADVGAAEGERIKVRVGFLAPEASSVVQEAKGGFRDAEARSGGRLHFVLYAGGVLGDEIAMVRKMRIGQIEAVAISGAVGAVVPDTSVLFLPFLFRTYEEVDHIRDRLFGHFEQLFEKEGIVLLLWFDVGGFNQFFSGKPVRTLEDLAQRKLWIWSGIPVLDAALSSFRAKAVRLEVPDVLPALQSDMVDSLFSNPLMILAFQVQKYLRYMTRLDFSYTPVVLMANRKWWDALAPELRSAMGETLKEYTPRMVRRAREDDETARRGLVKAGMDIITPTPDALAEFHAIGKSVWEGQAGRLYARSLLETIISRLEEYRAR